MRNLPHLARTAHETAETGVDVKIRTKADAHDKQTGYNRANHYVTAETRSGRKQTHTMRRACGGLQ